ncbi:MAG: TonB-dependent receptor domain-containing protein, partial [Blastocatellia bacterium]
GKNAGALRAESLISYEIGLTWRTRRLYARAQVFNAELRQPIVRRTLLFPAAKAPATLAGIPVQPLPPTAEQRARSVVTVATALDPRAVKAFVNDGAARYDGVETLWRYTLTSQWSIEGNYSFLAGRELNPNRFIRRLPPQKGMLALRWQTGWKAAWMELSADFAGAQKRLSGGDLTDERIGAARRRRDIADFFRGALIRPFLAAGADGVLGTNDDVFVPGGETLARIQDRVLPVGATINGVLIVNDDTRAPLYLATPGYAAWHVRGGWRITENLSLNFGVMNLLDKNYRGHGSGVDAPGVNLFAGVRISF